MCRWLLSASVAGLFLVRASTATLPGEIERAREPRVVAAAAAPPPSPPPADAGPPRIASVTHRPVAPPINTAPGSIGGVEPGAGGGHGSAAPGDSIPQARQTIAAGQERFRQVRDYTCTFVKREKVDGQLTSKHVMFMKARSNPHSIYFKFQQPNRGREAIYVHGRHDGRIVAHDVGLGKFLAGTMYLDPRGSMAMEENRHPVTDAGIGNLIETVARHWAVELIPGESVVKIHPGVRLADQSCTVIESIHPQPGPNFLFHKVKLYVHEQLGLPIRFEAYDWPKNPGDAPDLLEEYTYHDVKLNVGLRDHDFDPSNAHYSFGRL